MNRLGIPSILYILSFLVVSCSEKNIDHADTVYRNGTIITINDQNALAEAIATKDGLIIAVGTSEEVSPFEGPATNIVDLDRKVVVPGFIDAHSHFAGVGTQSIVANLLPSPDGPVNTIEDLQNALRDFLNNSPIARDYRVVIALTMMTPN